MSWWIFRLARSPLIKSIIMAMAFIAGDGKPLIFCHRQKSFSMLGGKGLANGDEIFTGIKAGGNFTNVRPQSFLVAQKGRARDRINLGTGIVDVVFGADVIASYFQKCRQGIAKHSTPAMADMQGAGGVCRDILYVCLDALAQFGTAVTVAQLQNRVQNFRPEGFLEAQIDEAGAGDFG